MSILSQCEIVQRRAVDDEAAFFACMGRFFASATVRRECGGYPLNDGPRYRWFIAQQKRQSRVLGFISLEQQMDVIWMREGYVRAEVRGQGLFRALRQHALAYVDELGLPCRARLPSACAAYLLPHGFQVQSSRGDWVSLRREAHATSDAIAQTG